MEKIGLSPATVEMILQMKILPDAKIVLMAMFHNGLVDTNFQQLFELINQPLNEIDISRTVLTADRINVNKVCNKISLSTQWAALVEENKNVQLQNRTNPATPADETNWKPGNSEAGLSAIKQFDHSKR